MNGQDYTFLKTAGRILNSQQTRTLLLTGNIHDLFRLQKPEETTYTPLINYLVHHWNLSDRMVLVYELNGPIRFMSPSDQDQMRDAWMTWRTGMDSDALAVKRMLAHHRVRSELDGMSREFGENMRSAIGNPTVALELLRQFCLCSRSEFNGRRVLNRNLIIIIEAADMVIPEGEIVRLSDADRHRISICQDWFQDPSFMNAGDCVILLSESRSLLNHRIARLPQIIEIPISAPDQAMRKAFIDWFGESNRRSGTLPDAQSGTSRLQLWGTADDLARYTAGLSIHALMQILRGSSYENRTLMLTDVVVKVEEYIQGQLGEDVVEFKKPTHSLQDIVGFDALKQFIRKELMPRFQSTGIDALSGAAVCGPIGSGKTFIFEAMAHELDMVVIVLKNIRSQWYGQTDVIFERLRRVLDVLSKVLIFVDEADTQFGGVGPEAHETERRLTGKIQAMMSDARLKGRVIWLLMTARIHLLSPDIRRPGRVGDLIIPILDPEGADRTAFIQWAVQPALREPLTPDQHAIIETAMQSFSAAGFAAVRSELKAKTHIKGHPLGFDEIREIIGDYISPPIEDTRRYQTLQALINCTRRSLLPESARDDSVRRQWAVELRELETRGIR